MTEKSPRGRYRGHFRQASLCEPHKTLSQLYNLANSEPWGVLHQGKRWSFAISAPGHLGSLSKGRKERRTGEVEGGKLVLY